MQTIILLLTLASTLASGERAKFIPAAGSASKCLVWLCSSPHNLLIYSVSQKSVPCVNETNSRNICSSGKNVYIFGNLRHVLIFWIYSRVNKMSVIRTRGGGGRSESLFFQHFQTYFCILSQFYDIFHVGQIKIFG